MTDRLTHLETAVRAALKLRRCIEDPSTIPYRAGFLRVPAAAVAEFDDVIERLTRNAQPNSSRDPARGS